MPHARPFAFAAIFVVAGCATAPDAVPSLAPRTAETIDPRVPVGSSSMARPVDRALASRLAELIGLARQGDSAFAAAAGEAERLAAAAGAPRTESWVVAQQAVSAAVAARGPITRALGDIDALAATALARRGGIALADLDAIEAAAAEVGAIDRRHSQTISSLQARLGG